MPGPSFVCPNLTLAGGQAPPTGSVAHLEERLICTQKVEGSSPFRSTTGGWRNRVAALGLGLSVLCDVRVQVPLRLPSRAYKLTGKLRDSYSRLQGSNPCTPTMRIWRSWKTRQLEGLVSART